MLSRWQNIRSRLIEWGSIALLVLIIATPLVFLGWLAVFTDTFTVQSITVVDARDHTTQSIHGIAQTLEGKHMFFLQTSPVESRLLYEIPQLHTVYIRRKLPSTLKIIAQEKQPVMLLANSGEYYFVDEKGIAYERATLDTLPGTLLPIVKNMDTEGSVSQGGRVVDEAFISFIVDVQDKLLDVVDTDIAEIHIPSLAAREVHFLLTNNWTIKMDTTRTPAPQLHVLTRLLEHTISSEEAPLIDYIDLRIPSRVYYKFRS